jgi:nucleoside-diphosphate-sugar epimerase
VTGAAGYVGLEVVRQLVAAGYYVRALVRALSRTEELERLGVEILRTDIRDRERLLLACTGMDVVVHLAAAMKGNSGFVVDCAVEGTRNVAEAAEACGIESVIHMSSMSVYDFLVLKNGDVLSEESPLEKHPEFRGAYSLAKRRSEEVALSRLSDARPGWTILRPAVIVGKNYDIYSPVGQRIGRTVICPGDRRKQLRLVHVEDVAGAVIRLIQSPQSRGRIFTLAEPEPITMGDYVRRVVRNSNGQNLRVLWVPRWAASTALFGISALQRMRGKGRNIYKHRMAYLYRDVRASSDLLRKQLGWSPPGRLLDRLFPEQPPMHPERTHSA